MTRKRVSDQYTRRDAEHRARLSAVFPWVKGGYYAFAPGAEVVEIGPFPGAGRCASDKRDSIQRSGALSG